MNFFRVLQVVLPIAVPVMLGIFFKRKQILSAACVAGMKTLVMQFGIPCLLFNAYLTCSFGGETVLTMGLVLLLTLVLAFIAFWLRKTARWNYHNLPMMFAVTEGGFGVPMMLALFGIVHTFRIAAMDLAQTLVGVPIITILSADIADGPRLKQILKKLVTVPVMIGMLLGLVFNFSGLGRILEPSGALGVIISATEAVAAPVSTLLLLCVGYEFCVSPGNRKDVLTMAVGHVVIRAIFCGIIQLVLLSIPGMAMETRWAVVLFSFLPPSFLTINLGKTDRENGVAASVCSLCTFGTILVYCVIAVFA